MMRDWMVAREQPIVLRSREAMAEMLMAVPAAERTEVYAKGAHERARADGDDDAALFWSEVLVLLRCCEEAGVVVAGGETRQAAGRFTRPVLEGLLGGWRKTLRFSAQRS